MTKRTAYLIASDDGLNQIEEDRATAQSEARELRTMTGLGVTTMRVAWYDQDAAADLLNNLLAQGVALGRAAGTVRQRYGK